MITTNKSKRQSSIELLRIIAQIGVVILHINNQKIGGGFDFAKSGTLINYYLKFTESLFIIGVDLFVIISSYFLSSSYKRRLSKVLLLILQVVLFKAMFYIAFCFVGLNTFSLKDLFINIIPSNYFVILYCVLYMVSPYINVLVNKLNQIQFKRLIILLLVIFSFYSYFIDILSVVFGVSHSLSSISSSGSNDGYTIVNFVLMYFLASYIKKYGFDKYDNKKLVAIFVINLMIIFFLSTTVVYKKAWNYNSPFVIINSLIIFIMFMKMDFNSNIINELSKAAFSCFLFHANILKLLKNTTKQILSYGAPTFIFYHLSLAILLYLLSYVVYFLYNSIVSKNIYKIIKRIDTFDIYKLD